MGNKIWPELPDPDHQRFLEGLYGTLCQHFVCLGVRLEAIDESGNTNGEQNIRFVSCFVMALNNRWCLVTAGHILKDIEEDLRSERFRIVHAFIIYYLGHHETDGRLMPFDYKAANKRFVDDENLGLDYGFIMLAYYDLLDLRKNNIIPVRMDYWKAQKIEEFNSFILLGLPVEVSRRLNGPFVSSNTLTRNLGNVHVSVEYITDDSQIPFTILIRKPTLPIFIGRITANIDFSINGMSGGPIFGLIEDQDSNLYYTVVAIQSAVVPTKNKFGSYSVVIGCYISEVIDEMRKFLQ